ncbi:MarR family protein [uncultured archaeon]|nr:MarR family protein [uncultured archaeon]
MKILNAALLLVLIASSVNAVDISIFDDLTSNALLTENITLTFTPAENTYSFHIPDGVQDVSAYGGSITNNTFTPDNKTCGSPCIATISYTQTDALESIPNNRKRVNRIYLFPAEVRNFTVTIALPPEYVLDAPSRSYAIVPPASTLSTDGTRTYITWTSQNPQLPRAYILLLSKINNHDEDGLQSLTSELLEWQTYAVSAVFACFGFIAGLLYNKRKKKEEGTTIESIPDSVLTPDEKTIVTTLEESGRINQKEIARKTGYSKAKVSAVVANLEGKRVVERERAGRSYIVQMAKKVVKERRKQH